MSWLGGSLNGNNSAFDFEVTIPTASYLYTLRADNGVTTPNTELLVDWGDGTVEQPTANNVTSHTYVSAGTYRIRTWQENYDPNDLTNRHNWLLHQSPMGGEFYSFGLTIMDIIPFMDEEGRDTPGWDLSSCKNWPMVPEGRTWKGTFRAKSTTYPPCTFPDVLNWCPDGWSPGQMNLLFFNQSTINCDVSSWDVSECPALPSIFRATPFDNNGNDDLNNWDVSSVASFSQAFRFAASFNRDIPDWDLSSCSTLQRTFQGATLFNRDISGWFTNGTGIPSGIATFLEMLDGTAMSTDNYSRFLIGAANWADDVSPAGKPLGANGLTYDATVHTGIGTGTYTDAVSARAYLVTQGWTITGDSVV